MAEYCDTPHSKERRNREYKVCLNESAILRLLDHGFIEEYQHFVAHENGINWLLTGETVQQFYLKSSDANKTKAVGVFEELSRHWQ